MSELYMLVGLGYLSLYIYFGVNALMLVLEEKIDLKPLFLLSDTASKRAVLTQVNSLMSSDKNPNSYKVARVYLVGTFSMLVVPIVLILILVLIEGLI